MSSIKKENVIKPEKVGGFLDYLPPVMLARQHMLDVIKTVYELFGFMPLDTPAVEKLDVLTGNNPDFRMNLYRVLIATGLTDINEAAQKCDADLALRFDLTVPLSRVIAAYPDKINKPFKRYQIGKVWRGERVQAGRYREFVQFDADIIGSRSTMADTEIIQLMYEVMTALGFSNFLIKINNRKIFEGLNKYVGLEDKSKEAEMMRIIDKLEKIGNEAVAEELKREPDNKYDPAPNLSSDNIDKILSFISITGSHSEVLDKAEKIVGGVEIGKEGIDELHEIVRNLEVLEIPEKNWAIDLSLARGLGYYTGPVFETTLNDMPEIGSVFSGGRFDGLVDRFVPNSNIPGTGASVGVDRLFVAMEKLGKIEIVPSLTKVLVVMFDSTLRNDYLRTANQIRKMGISTEIYFDEVSLKTQFTYAAKQEIPLVVIIGSKEKAENKVALKNMRTRTQETVDKNQLLDRIKQILKE